jgi:hypothetical protein
MLIEKGNKMSIEEYMLDTGKSLENEMTDFEKKCYGMSESDIREQYMEGLTGRLSGNEMVVMGILSDCQELLGSGKFNGMPETIRKQLNVAKFILSEMMDAKQTA